MNKLMIPLLIIVSVFGVLLLRFGFIFVMLALLPSVVAYYMKVDTANSTFKTVLACNLAGALPYFVPMVRAAIEFKPYDITPIVVAPHVWLVVYGAAAAGWGLISLSRFIARFILTMMYEYRVVSLERMQKKLVAEWGNRLLHQHGH